MNDPAPSQSESSFSSALSIDATSRYQGMIELSTYKKLRNNLFQLFDHVTLTTPPYWGLHTFISYLRLFQIFGPCFAARFYDLWGKHSLMRWLNDVISVCYTFVPASLIDECSIYINFIYSAVFIIFYFVLIGASVHYEKNADLPNAVPKFISIFFGTLGYIIPCMTVYTTFVDIGRMIAGTLRIDGVHIASDVLSLLTTGIFAWLYTNIYSVSLLFKPDSLMTIIPSVQVKINVLNLFNYACVGVAGELGRIPQIVLVFCTCLGYWGMVFVTNLYGGLVNPIQKRITVSTMIACGILCIICGFFIIFNLPANEVILLVLVGVWIVAFIIYSIILNITTRRHLDILDAIEDDQETFDLLIRSPSKFGSVIITGFHNAHPICIDWTMFKIAIEVWPKEINVWFLFAKFTAIYPEFTSQLDMIAVSIVQHRLKGSFAKNILSQIKGITKQRETNLIPSIKSKLEHLTKQVQSTKHKLRYVWDLIIQGNFHELETVIEKANKAVTSCESEFQHLLAVYPNSRFVARNYSVFLRDIMADYEGHEKWKQNITTLQRGESIFPDQAHEFGMRAFPLLPQKHINDGDPTQGLITDDTLTQEIEPEDEQMSADAELRLTIRDSIDHLKIPSYVVTKCIFGLTYFVLFVIPVVVITIIIPIVESTMFTPLEFLDNAGKLQVLYTQSLALAHQLTMESIGALDPLDLFGDKVPSAFGGSADTREQVIFVAQKFSTAIDTLSTVTTFKPNDADMTIVRDITFTPSFNFMEFKEDITYHNISFSTQQLLSKYVVMIQELLKKDLVAEGPAVLHDKLILTMFANFRSSLSNFNTINSAITNYIRVYTADMQQLFTIIMAVLVCAIFIINIGGTFYGLSHVKGQKMLIYKSIVSLPKNVISRVSDSFKVLKKVSENDTSKTSHAVAEEMNKQEENLLKIFTTSADSKGSVSDAIIIIITTSLTTILSIAAVVILFVYLLDATEVISDAAPQVINLSGSYAYDFCAVIALKILTCQINSYPIVLYKPEQLALLIIGYQQQAVYGYNAVRWGNSTQNVKPFYILSSEDLRGLTPPECSANPDFIPNNYHAVYRCWNAELLISYIQSKVSSLVSNYLAGNTWDKTDETFVHIWHAHICHLYEEYYQSLFKNTVPAIEEYSMKTKVTSILIAYILLVVDFFVIMVMFAAARNSENRQKFALKLLLHCPANVVIGNSSIAQIISGNFSNSHVDSTTRDTTFYDELVKDIPDAVITSTMDGKIVTANHSADRMFANGSDSLVGHSLHDFVKNFVDQKHFAEIGSRDYTAEDEFEEVLEYKNSEGDTLHIDTSLTIQNDHIILSMLDNTQTVMYNKLISDEKAKSDNLLQQILPPRLVPRVQAGETNISFAVQSVSVLFMDIVSFTPWCGSNTSQFVMSTLNKYFKYIDALVPLHPTMTKIKCIGDCYMAAAGIFLDVNQPATHAKDITEFGLEAIETLQKLNAEINQSLQIRVGINTGGPIVAGVIGNSSSKPTFEILGPTINMAQQMEHHGVPMKVHISRSVYELIYGGQFVIKERGEVQVKKGTVVTYIVEGKK